MLIEAVEIEPGRGLLMVFVPQQPEPLWPFLVCGTIISKKVLSNHFSLVRRRGDETADDTAAVVHGLMVAGRAAAGGVARGPGAVITTGQAWDPVIATHGTRHNIAELAA